MQVQGTVGPVASTASLSSGLQANVRLGNMGDTIMSYLHARYYEATYRKARFHAATQAVTALSAGLGTTYTGLVISNPINSTVNLVLGKVGWTFIVVFAAVAGIGIACGYNSGTNVTHTSAVTPRSNFFNTGTTGQGLADVSATLPTAPFYTHILGAGLTGAVTTIPSLGPTNWDAEGDIILPPGGYCAFVASAVSAASSFWGSMSWEEVPA